MAEVEPARSAAGVGGTEGREFIMTITMVLVGRQIVQDDVDLTTEARKAPRQTSLMYNAACSDSKNGNPRLPRYSME